MPGRRKIGVTRKSITKKYMSAYGALYGNLDPTLGVGSTEGNKLTGGTLNGLKVGIAVPTEQQEQFKLVYWLKNSPVMAGVRFHASPNGGKRDPIEGAKLKRLGCSAGFPDIIIPCPSKGYAGLYIELKRQKGGAISTQQRDWIIWLNANGSKAVVCKGCDEAIKAIEDYFSE